jgi:hypothetical protein
MDWLIIKMFGVNRVNLVGWSITGLVVMVLAGVGITVGLLSPPGIAAQGILLATICLLLLGIFGVALQIYCSLLAEKLTTLQRANATKLDEEE